jgi:hypothetical protein
MKTLALAALVPLLAAAAATPPPSPPSRAPHRFTHSCDLHLNVVDPDPKGLNVRSGPGKPPARVIAVLAPVGEWIDVHVVGQAGEWLLIDAADAIDDEAPEGLRELFRGGGWVHVAGLGISELSVGQGTRLRAAPDAGAAVVRDIPTPEDEPKHVRVLGCRGPWLEVEADGVHGFTDTFCTNERTTCS